MNSPKQNIANMGPGKAFKDTRNNSKTIVFEEVVDVFSICYTTLLLSSS